MKMRYTLIILVTFFTIHPRPEAAIELDSISAVVVGPEKTDVITKSDVTRPGIDGRVHSLETRTRESQISMDAEKYKMVDEDSVERQLKEIKRENNLSDEELEQIFTAGGYTIAEGKEQFKTMTGVNQMTGFRIMSRLTISHREMELYWNENPVYLEPSYELVRATTDFDVANTVKDLQRKMNDHSVVIAWSEPFTINESEVAEDKQFICKLKPGQIKVVKHPDFFELFKSMSILPRRPVPLAEREQEIDNVLREKKYRTLFQEYQEELNRTTAVIRF